MSKKSASIVLYITTIKIIFFFTYTSFTAQYLLYDVSKNGTQTSLSLKGDPEVGDLLQMAQWSPIGHSLAIVLGNDLYYLEDASSMTQSKRLTTNGATDLLFNGIADWLYEGTNDRLGNG